MMCEVTFPLSILEMDVDEEGLNLGTIEWVTWYGPANGLLMFRTAYRMLTPFHRRGDTAPKKKSTFVDLRGNTMLDGHWPPRGGFLDHRLSLRYLIQHHGNANAT